MKLQNPLIHSVWMKRFVWLSVLALLVLPIAAIASPDTVVFQVKNIDPRTGQSGLPPDQPTYYASNDLLLFAGRSVDDEEPWVSDGTPAGTFQLRNINPAGSSDPGGFAELNGFVYFKANDGSSIDLWRSNGTPAGTVKVSTTGSFDLGANPERLRVVGDTLFYVANGAVDLYKFDGTPGGSGLVKANFGHPPNNLTAFNGFLFFSASQPGNSNNIELWRSNGTEAGTVLVKDVNPSGSSRPLDLVTAGNLLYFTADDGSSGRELWKTNGNVNNGSRVRDINTGPDGSEPRFLTAQGNVLFFAANNATHGNELWRSEGQFSNTQMVRDIYPGSIGSNPSSLAVLNGTLLFSALDPDHGKELWRSNGTQLGTFMVKDIRPGFSIGSAPSQLVAFGDWLYFRADDGNVGQELWLSDGTELNTMLADDINPGPDDANVFPMAGLANTFLYRANDGSTGDELWGLDTNSIGTNLPYYLPLMSK